MLVVDGQSLESLSQRWSGQRAIALDTEFIRERTYFPELCLLQLAVDSSGVNDEIFLIDVLAFPKLPHVTKVLINDWGGEVIIHSMQQDIEALGRSAWTIGGRWYDTQIAAAHLDWDLQVGYAKLVHDITGVTLEKGQQRTNWSRRPLSAKQLDYAANDVRYLFELRDTLDDRLNTAGRREWAVEDMEDAYRNANCTAPPEEAYRRIKSFYRQNAEVRRRIRCLTEWRDRTSIDKNLPRGWVIKDDELVSIARAGKQARLPKAWRSKLVEVLDRADQSPMIDVDTKIPRPPSEEEKAHRKVIVDRLSAFSKEHGMANNVVATRAELDAIAAQKIPPRFDRGWRAEHVLPRLTRA